MTLEIFHVFNDFHLLKQLCEVLPVRVKFPIAVLIIINA